MTINLKEGEYATLQLNLSSLARKHRDDGLSMEAIRKAIPK